MKAAFTKTALSITTLISASLSSSAFAQQTDHGNSKEAHSDLWSQAQAYWGAEEMRKARHHVLEHHGASKQFFVMADRLETQFDDANEVLLWDGDLWYGGDVNKAWIKTEGEYKFDEDEFDDAEVQALWSHAISTYFNVQTGLRYDIKPRGAAHAVIGVQGLAPYWFEIDAAGFVSEDGDVTLRIESEYEFLLTQRLIFQPRIELELSAQDIPARETGAGVSGLDAGLRLRYEVLREFAPYIGFEWHGAFGETADYIRDAGGDPKDMRFVIGVRAWF